MVTLPDGWCVATCPDTSNVFYDHTRFHHSQWEVPTAQCEARARAKIKPAAAKSEALLGAEGNLEAKTAERETSFKRASDASGAKQARIDSTVEARKQQKANMMDQKRAHADAAMEALIFLDSDGDLDVDKSNIDGARSKLAEGRPAATAPTEQMKSEQLFQEGALHAEPSATSP